MTRLRISPSTFGLLGISGLGWSVRPEEVHGFFDGAADLLGVVIPGVGGMYRYLLMTGKGPLQHRWELLQTGAAFSSIGDAEAALSEAMDSVQAGGSIEEAGAAGSA